MKTKKVFTAKEKRQLNRAFELISAVRQSLEDRGCDVELSCGNGTIDDQLSCSLAGLDCIYQEYQF